MTRASAAEHPILDEDPDADDPRPVEPVDAGDGSAAPDSTSTPAPDVQTGTRRTTFARWGAWLLAFVAFLLPMASWSLATPEYGSPDEFAHVYRAAAVVRGEIVAPEGSSGGGSGLLLVPKGFTDTAAQVRCFAYKAGATADCLVPVADNPTLVEVTSGAARYNPAYYLAVGWPSLISPGSDGLFAMRLLSAAICAALLASAALSLAHGRGGRLLLGGMVLAATPMVLFLGGMVNPSGVEIAAALSVWAALLRLCTGHDGETGRLLRRFGIAGSVLVLSRGLSPAWLAVIGITTLALANRDALGAVFKRRDTWLWTGLVAASTAASVSWTVIVGTGTIVDLNDGPDRSLLGAISFQTRSLGIRLQEFVGIFGWTDTPSPAVAIALYAVAFGGLVVAALAVARWRTFVILAALLGVVVVGPLVIEASQFNLLGLFWQSRYIMPVSVGITLVAAYALHQYAEAGSERFGRRPVVLIVLTMGVIQLLGFGQALIRYQTGLALTLNPFSGAWHPAVGSLTVLVMQAVGLLLIAVFALFIGVGPSAAPSTIELEESDSWYAERQVATQQDTSVDPAPTTSGQEFVDHEYDDTEIDPSLRRRDREQDRSVSRPDAG